MFGESPTCLLANTKHVCSFIYLFKQWLFSGRSSVKPNYMEGTAKNRPMDRYCGPLQLLQSYLWSLCCLSDYCPPCLVCEFWWAALSWQGCCGATFFQFFYIGFNGAPWDVQSFGYYFITQPWSALLHNFVPDLFGEHLGIDGATCLVMPLA